MRSSCTFLWAVGILLSGVQLSQAQFAPANSGASDAEEGQAVAYHSVTDQRISLAPNDAFTQHSNCGCETCRPRHVGRDFKVCKDRCGGLLGGVEFLYLRPYASEGALDNGIGQMNFNPSMRYWLGWQNADGLGMRIRYWEFNRTTSAPAAAGGFSLEYRTLDAEVTKSIDFRSANLLFSGGMRYAETGADGAPFGFPFANGFNGIGLTFATQAAYNLNQSGSLRVVAGGRFSSVFGNTNTNFFGGPFVFRDDLVNIVELSLGPQYRRLLKNGAYLTVGAGFETQYWNNGSPANVDTQDLGFAGFTSSICITR